MNPNDLFVFDDFRLAADALRAATNKRDRYVLLLGDSGAGKSCLFLYVRETLDRCRVRVLYIHIARLGPGGCIHILARLLRVPIRRCQPETVQAIAAVLAEDPCLTCIWIDDASSLPDETLLELQTLAEFDLEGKIPLSLVLSGPPSFRERLHAPHLFPLFRRFQNRIEITGLRANEVRPFVVHKLGKKLAARFSDDALAALHEHSRGLPGLLVPYLDLIAQQAPDGPISPDIVHTVVQTWNVA